VLPSVNRMRRASDFGSVVRGGRRARSGSLVVHHLAHLTTDAPPLVGLIVGKSVGGSVTRHAVSRKLRAQLSRRLGELPLGSGTVVRALPGADRAVSQQLATDLDAALGRLLASAR
jgi:ribonuclease P protein component